MFPFPKYFSDIMQGVQGKPGSNKMKQVPFMGIVCVVMLVIVYRTTNYQYQQTEVPFNVSTPENMQTKWMSHSTKLILFQSTTDGMNFVHSSSCLMVLRIIDLGNHSLRMVFDPKFSFLERCN